MASPKNRRRGGARVRLDVPARIETLRGTVNAMVREVSRGGVYIDGTAQPTGSVLKVTFVVDGLRIQFEGEVRYQHVREGQGPGMGIRFIRLESTMAAALEKLIASRPAS